MKVNLNKKDSVEIEVDKHLKYILIVCSHERSGTHFLMNSISENSPYSVKPWLNFDLSPLGDIVNFYSHKSINNFFNKLTSINKDQNSYTLASIIKSHHHADFFGGCFNNKKIKFLYIYRDPKATLNSFWKFLHRWEWDEGLKADTPLDFAKAQPSGQLMRYQKKTCKDHFSRWEEHVNGWLNAKNKYANVMTINFDDLSKMYVSKITEIMEFLGINIDKNKIRYASKKQYIHGVNKELDQNQQKEFSNFIDKKLINNTNLKNLFKN